MLGSARLLLFQGSCHCVDLEHQFIFLFLQVLLILLVTRDVISGPTLILCFLLLVELLIPAFDKRVSFLGTLRLSLLNDSLSIALIEEKEGGLWLLYLMFLKQTELVRCILELWVHLA